MALDDATTKRMAALQAAATYIAGLNGTTEDVVVTADIFLQYIDAGAPPSPAQQIANSAYYCVDKEEFAELWRRAAKADLMTLPVTLGMMTGPLGEYLKFKAEEFKEPAA
jgi:hypothetical protein